MEQVLIILLVLVVRQLIVKLMSKEILLCFHHTKAKVSQEVFTVKMTLLAQQKLTFFILIGDPSLYSAVYSDLSRFIESSLDVYRHELSLILYPVFVHMYLELVYNGHETAAKDFIATFGPRQESFYQEDIKKLSYITKREHMRGSELMENFRTSQFTVRMSRDSKRFYILNCQIDTEK